MAIRDRLVQAGRDLLVGTAETALDLFKAEKQSTMMPLPDKTEEEPKTLHWDPFSIIEQLGFKDKPSAMTYGTLKAIMYRLPIIRAIIQTRTQQVSAFCQPTRSKYDLGFKLRLRESDKNLTQAGRKWAKGMEDIILHTGVSDNPKGRDNFETFLRKSMRDSLLYDQLAWEIIPDRKGRPAEWYAVDAATMRLADSASSYINEDETQATRYVQIYDGMVINEYTQDELYFGIRNPSTDIRLYGYGESEIEMLVKAITALLFALEYNQKAFSQGSAHKGILNFKGAIPDKQMRQFRRHWYQHLSGVENSWRTPITNADEIQWISMHASNRDMEYNAWVDFQIKVACSIYTIDPAEVNFQYGNVGVRSTLAEQSNKEKVTESKERGLRPLLRFIERAMNEHIIWPTNQDFEFSFVGLDVHSRDEQADLNSKLVKTIRTIDEIRAEEDLDPLPDGLGEVILDPQFMAARNMALAQAGQEEEEDSYGEQDGGDEGVGAVPDFASLFGEMEEGEEEGSAKPGAPAKEAGTAKMAKGLGKYRVDIRL